MSEVDMSQLASNLFPSMSGDPNVPNSSPGKPANPEPRSPQPVQRKTEIPSNSQPKIDAAKEGLAQTKALASIYDKSPSRERDIMEAAKEEMRAEQPARPVAATSEDVASVIADFGMAPNESTEALGEWAGQHGVSRDAVNQLMEIRDSHMAALAAAQSDAWYDETIATVDKFTIQSAQAGLDRYGDDDFVAMLNDTGLINHPAMIRFLASVAKGK